GAGLHGDERVAAVAVGSTPGPAEVAPVGAATVGLPELDHRVRDRRALAVEDPALQDDRAGRAVRHDLVLRRHAESEREIRADGLRRREREAHSASSGVAALPPTTMSKR